MKKELTEEEVEYLTQFANAFGYDIEEFFDIYTEIAEEYQ